MKTLIEFDASKDHPEGGAPDYFHNYGLFWILELINWEIANIHFVVLLKLEIYHRPLILMPVNCVTA